ncbi:Homeobox-like_domain superfamily [Hexamita inflata]|uniref:Homeobox-like domain superfamily n=1 Tax=Hexamita inflata TaxID=28002 RepID=A0AA86QLL4_9EUKA|nr:Homeobox-like domain superfamily [Hexamita inflata]
MSKWCLEYTEQLKEILKKNPNPNVFELAKQFKCSLSTVKTRISSARSAEKNAFKLSPEKLTMEEKKQILEIISKPEHPNCKQLTEQFGKLITHSILQKIKKPRWGDDDKEKLHDLFKYNQNTQSLDWYQEQFENSKKDFVKCELSFLTKNNRKLMPEKTKFWTDDRIRTLMQLAKRFEKDFAKVSDEMGLGERYVAECKNKYNELINKKEEKSKSEIKKILEGKKK